MDPVDSVDVAGRLESQLETLEQRIAPTRPHLALELLWRFMTLGAPLFEIDDDECCVSSVFERAVEDIVAIAVKAQVDPVLLAKRVFTALTIRDHDYFFNLIPAILPAFGEDGSRHLKERLRAALGQGAQSGAECADQSAALRGVLRKIAESEGDVDGYLAFTPVEERKYPRTARGIAMGLQAGGREREAAMVLAQASFDDEESPDFSVSVDGYLEALDADGQQDKAQRLRLAGFRKFLGSDRLRSYLRRLPKSEAAAIRHAINCEDAMPALEFLVRWGALGEAATLILRRHRELKSGFSRATDEIARELAQSHPLAAVVLSRRIIRDILERAMTARYSDAVRHMMQCEALDDVIADYGQQVCHGCFCADLNDRHGRKHSFWNNLKEDDAAPPRGLRNNGSVSIVDGRVVFAPAEAGVRDMVPCVRCGRQPGSGPGLNMSPTAGMGKKSRVAATVSSTSAQFDPGAAEAIFAERPSAQWRQAGRKSCPGASRGRARKEHVKGDRACQQSGGGLPLVLAPVACLLQRSARSTGI
ncbi:MAG: hypothetical protein FWD68_18450 [Alphaproteobacteria bacterium]|nr:hypothetical protein [Alphaproteobacteria bacterium]